MHPFVCVCMCLCVYLHPCVYVHSCVCVYMCLCIHVSVCASVCLCVHASLCVCASMCVCAFMCLCVHVSVCASVSLCVHVSVYASVCLKLIPACQSELTRAKQPLAEVLNQTISETSFPCPNTTTTRDCNILALVRLLVSVDLNCVFVWISATGPLHTSSSRL